MRIVLIRPDFKGITHKPDMPIGLLYIASAIEKAGYELTVLDLNRQELVDLTTFDVVCFSMLPLARKNTWEMIEKLKGEKSDIKIVLGGVFPSSIPVHLLNSYPIDAIVVGEGELTIVDLLNHWDKGLDIKNVQGIATKKHGIHELRPLMNINEVGVPAWHYSNVNWFKMTFAMDHPQFECNGLVLNDEKFAPISACYDEQTEILTKNGWKYFRNLSKNDSVATLNPSNNNLEYHQPIRILKYNYGGEMIKIDSKQINLLVTPNHKLYLENRCGQFKLINAETTSGKRMIRGKKDAIWNGVNKKHFILPGIIHYHITKKKIQIQPTTIDIDDWLKFMGYYLSEGCTHKKSNNRYITKISQSQEKKEFIYNNIKNTLKRLNIHFYEYKDHKTDKCNTAFEISNKQLHEYLIQFGNQQKRFVPQFIKELTSSQIKIFLEAFAEGDGSFKKGEISCFYSTSKKLMDDLQELLLKAGWSGNIKNKKLEDVYIKERLIKKENCHPSYYMSINRKQNEPYFNKHSNKFSTEQYLGKVYCCEVKNHIVYVRRNGIVCWSGNSRGCPNFVKPCSFCHSPTFWRYKYRIRSSELVLDEVETLYKDYGVRVFSFNDDAFPVSPRQCIEFCQGLKTRGLKIAWKSDTRADVITLEMAKAMKESGCFMVAIGVESGSKKILDSIHKNLDLERAKKTIAILKEVDIIAYVLLMVGNVGETRDTIMETKNFLEDTKPDIFTWVQGVLICPGTELDDLAKEQGLITNDYWTAKTNGLPIYHGELTKEEIQTFANILSSTPQRQIE